MATKSTQPLQWMKVWLDENSRKTARLSTLEYGAYMLLERAYWMAGPPDDDNNLLARITGLSIAEWHKIRPAVEPLFLVAGGQWVNPQIDADMESMYSAMQKNRARTAAATKARRSKDQRNGVRSGERNGVRYDVLDDNVDVHQDFKGANQKPLAKRESVSAPGATDSDGDHSAGDSLPGWEGCHVY
ncbi:MAG: YdaU family protein [Candidatus Accumulibacter sp.]|uniref:DUF1376 domain-containing protein n=1 Tax=Accumulibacter sp. TaxID=2053492 RepID=UPI001B163BBC|nr:DUF1376 domain-containing protein [Accumulibacter sp.]MBO3704279.1 YdaU family protein [Accumulibacter sp.]